MIEGDLIRFYPNMFMLIFFILIEVFLRRHNLSLRILTVTVNHAVTIYYYLYNEDVDMAA